MNRREFGLEKFSEEQFLIGGVTLFLTGVIGVIGNLLVLATIYRILRHKRNIPNVLILFLAWIDLLVFPLVYPQPLVKYFYGIYIGDYMGCDFQATCIVCLFTLSILLVVLMSFDRLLALFKPFYYDKQIIYDKEKIRVASICFGCSVLTISLLPAFGVGRNVLHFPGTFCLFEWRSDSFEGQAVAHLFVASLGLAMFVVLVCNLATVFLSLRLNERQQNNCKRRHLDVESANTKQIASETTFSEVKVELQFAKLSGSVAVAFVSCWGLFLVSPRSVAFKSFKALLSCTLVSFAVVIRVVMQRSSPTNGCSLELCIPFLKLTNKEQASISWKPGPLAANVTRNMIGGAANSYMHVVCSQ